MAEKNLSPRQKMINLMYLVLTALLALNVSAEVLHAFVKIEQSIRKSTRIIENKNSELYGRFAKLYQENPKKVQEWYDKAQGVKEHSDSLYNYIQELKVKVVRAADGPEGNPTEIKHKDENNVGGQVMILQGNGKKLKEAIIEYKKYLLSLMDAKDTTGELAHSLDSTFDVRDVRSEDGSMVPWEFAMFDQLPLIAVVANMSKIQNDIRMTENSFLSYLLEKIGAGEWKFNKLEPIVYAEKGYVLQGEPYEAKIFIAAYDTTQQPIIVLDDGTKLPVENGKGIYKVDNASVGIHSFSGVIKLKSPASGEYVSYPFKGEFQVAAPAVAISPTKMNVFYIGVDNPVAITASGVPADALLVSIGPIGTIKKVGTGKYIVRVNKVGKTTVSVSAKVGDQTRRLGSMQFRCKVVPDPKARVGNLKPGPVAKAVLLAQTFVKAELENFVFDLKFPVVGFTVSATIGSFTEEYPTKGARITQKQKNLIRQLKRGQKVYFENIKARAPDGSIRDLGTISFKIVR